MLHAVRARIVAVLLLTSAVACDKSDPPPGAQPENDVTDARPADAKLADPKPADAGHDAAVADAGAADVAAEASPEANGADPTAADAKTDATSGDAEPEPEPEPFACLPDGSGRITIKASGGLTLDVHGGNMEFCAGSPSEDQKELTLIWVVPAAGTDLKASVQIELKGFTKGQTVTGKAVAVNVAIAGEMGNIWRADDLCTADVTMNTLVGPGPEGGTRYKLVGAARCSAPLPGLKPNTLAISAFEFATGVVYP